MRLNKEDSRSQLRAAKGERLSLVYQIYQSECDSVSRLHGLETFSSLGISIGKFGLEEKVLDIS